MFIATVCAATEEANSCMGLSQHMMCVVCSMWCCVKDTNEPKAKGFTSDVRCITGNSLLCFLWK